MEKYLFLLTIGPVQSFIEQARKTQDLKAGSQMLSDMIDFAIGLLPEDSKVVFPYPGIVSKPNRLITVVETSDMSTLGNDLKQAITNHFLDKAKELMAKTRFYEDCITQLKDFFKIHWVARKYEEQTTYPAQHQRLEQLMGAVKAHRPFVQLEEKGRKCAMNGEYNVKFYRKTLTETEKQREVKGTHEKLFHSEALVVDYGKFNVFKESELGPGEGLCAMSLLKRLYLEESFPSVAEIATLKERRLLSPEKKAWLKKYQKTFRANVFMDACLEEFEEVKLADDHRTKLNTHFDYQLVYPENIHEKNFPLAAQRMLADRYAARINLKSKYYAILLFDADSMGKALQDQDQVYQESLSECLGAFAAAASAYVNGQGEDHTPKGRTVYAGGDDFLGLINLDYLLEVLYHLRHMFDAMVNIQMVNQYQQSNPTLTFSAGVAIAHYKTPISEVLQWARKSEKKAKDTFKENDPPKNAFCLTVLKHSGEMHQTVWQWSYSPTDLAQTMVVMQQLLEKLLTEEVSARFIKNLRIEFRQLISEQGEISIDLMPLLEFELTRLMCRAKHPNANPESITQLASTLYTLFSESGTYHLAGFIDLLEMIDFIHRQLPNYSPVTSTPSL